MQRTHKGGEQSPWALSVVFFSPLGVGGVLIGGVKVLTFWQLEISSTNPAAAT